MRKAFSMVTAIFVIVIMATIAALVLSVSGKAVKETSLLFRTEQAALLARSYTEYAVMAVIHHERNATSGCVEEINATVGSIVPSSSPPSASETADDYHIQTRIYYIGNGLPCSHNHILASSLVSNYNDTSSADSLAAIVVDVFVRYADPDHPDDLNLTYHRRTLQKI